MRRRKGIRRHAAQIALCRKFAAGKAAIFRSNPFRPSHTSNFGATRMARVRISFAYSSSTRPSVYDPDPMHSVTAKSLLVFALKFVNKSPSGFDTLAIAAFKLQASVKFLH